MLFSHTRNNRYKYFADSFQSLLCVCFVCTQLHKLNIIVIVFYITITFFFPLARHKHFQYEKYF